MPESVGVYKVLEWTGASGIGEVFRARDTLHGRTVALRIVSAEIADDPDLKARFLADARAAASLSHPNIAIVYETGEDEGLLFVASEFVAGQPLSRVIGGRGLNPRRAIDYATQVADALAEAHAADVPHGGLTSSNIVVTAKGTLKILDFGLASWSGNGRSEENPDDLRSLGEVLYEMATGTSIAGQEPAPAVPGALNRVPPEVNAIVSRLFEKDDDRKYGSAATVAAELRAAAETLDARSEVSRRPSVVTHDRPSPSVRWWLLPLIALAAAAAWFILQR